MVKEVPLVWLAASGCTGCSVSLLNSASPTIKNILVDQIIPGVHINLRFHQTIMAGAGELVIKALEATAAEKKGGMFWLSTAPSLPAPMLHIALWVSEMVSRSP